jgi:hypothetical protein
MVWACDYDRKGKKCIQYFVGKPLGKRPLGSQMSWLMMDFCSELRVP